MQTLDFLDRRLYGASVTRWLQALAVLLVVYAALALTRRLIGKRVGHWTASTATDWDDLLVDLVARTRWFFLATLALLAATRVLPRVADAGWIRPVVVLASLIQAGVWGNAIIAFLSERYTRLKTSGDIGSRATVRAVGFAIQAVLWILLGTMALGTFGIEIRGLLTGLGIGGVAVALAAQNILGDLFAAMAIVLDRPFVIGDFIVLGEAKGTVEHIGLKTTRIRSLSGEQIAIANGELLKGRIQNYGRMNERRVVFTIDVTYDTPPDVVAGIPGIIRAVIESQSRVRFDRSHFLTFADWSLRFETVYYVLDRDYNVYADTHHAINIEILRRFNAAGIEFAFPSRTLFMRPDGPGDVKP